MVLLDQLFSKEYLSAYYIKASSNAVIKVGSVRIYRLHAVTIVASLLYREFFYLLCSAMSPPSMRLLLRR